MNFNARQYDPQIGRFLSIDPLAYVGGQQVHSPYAAMGNDPGMMIDPNGTRSKYANDPTEDGNLALLEYHYRNMLGGNRANGGYIADISLSVSYSPTNSRGTQGFINKSVGIGVGVGAFGGAQYQSTIGSIPVWQWNR